jgi:ribosomal protein S18 acetylase RimI-like enzyme
VTRYLIRPAEAEGEDLRFLRTMLCYAARWRTDEYHEEALAEPAVARYLANWGRQGDEALIAEAADRRLVGAAWYRTFAFEGHGFGFVAPDIPELSVAVEPACRGRGVGTALLEGLVAQARASGYSALSLSVEEDNPAMSLYERIGFRRVRRTGDASTMLLPLG